MESRITATELAIHLSTVLSRIGARGERFIIERNGIPVAVLGPASAGVRSVTLRDVADHLGDLALPGDGFAEDLEAIQAAQPRAEAPLWPS